MDMYMSLTQASYHTSNDCFKFSIIMNKKNIWQGPATYIKLKSIDSTKPI